MWAGFARPLGLRQVPAYALRTKTNMHRTIPLRALWQHPPYSHDGSRRCWTWWITTTRTPLGLTNQQKARLVEYLKSLW